MSKRTIVLLIIAVAIWAGALFYYLLLMNKGEATTSFPSTRTPKSSLNIKITPEFLESYQRVVEERVETKDLFSPYYTEKGKDYLRRLVVESENILHNPSFAGYIITKGGGKIFLKMGGKIMPVGVNDLVLNRYLIVYTSSVGVVVLDVEKGGLYVIK